MDNVKKELVDKLKSANNILITVSRNPTVDQLASCLGLALLLNKQGKHSAAVFSGQVPSTIEFLKPEETLEKNTDSLRDFIIALDKSKADKLRYKVEDNVVRIFITPYKTSISQADLDFSQGDFNVDLVVAIGVDRQEDLDEAITAHGRILHDAVLASINITPDGGLGSINWHNTEASSLSELVTELVELIDASQLDGQISTALLTGIVSATDRFSNSKTSSSTMNASAKLMAAGANQQLVASKLDETERLPAAANDNAPAATSQEESDPVEEESNDGSIAIKHDSPAPDQSIELPTPEDNDEGLQGDSDNLSPSPDMNPMNSPVIPNLTQNDDVVSGVTGGSQIMDTPPSLGGTLTANSQVEALDPVTDPMSTQPSNQPILEHNFEPTSSQAPPPELTPPPSTWDQPANSLPPLAPVPGLPMTQDPESSDSAFSPAPEQSLSDLEREVKASEQSEQTGSGLDSARDEVNRALSSSDSTPSPSPIQALNAQPLVDNLHSEPNMAESPVGDVPTIPGTNIPSVPSMLPSDFIQPDSNPTMMATPPPFDNNMVPGPQVQPMQNPQVNDPNAPPPVPPPIPFQFGNS